MSTNNKFINYIKKHWRGEFSLKRSFWINKVLFSIILLIACLIIAVIESKLYVMSSNPEKISQIGKACSSVMIIIFMIFYFWESNGTWKAATLYTKQYPPFLIFGWGRIVKILMIIQLLSFSRVFN